MRAGLLRHRITAQTVSETADGHGEPVPTWTDLLTVGAKVMPLRGGERMAAQQTQAEVTHKVLVRYSATMAGLTAKDRIVWGSRTLEVLANINVGERNRELEIWVKERV